MLILAAILNSSLQFSTVTHSFRQSPFNPLVLQGMTANNYFRFYCIFIMAAERIPGFYQQFFKIKFVVKNLQYS